MHRPRIVQCWDIFAFILSNHAKILPNHVFQVHDSPKHSHCHFVCFFLSFLKNFSMILSRFFKNPYTIADRLTSFKLVLSSYATERKGATDRLYISDAVT